MVKVKKIKDLYFIFIILFSGLSTSFYRNEVGWILLLIIGLFVFHTRTFKPTRIFFASIAIWMGYFLINTFTIHSFHVFFMMTYIIHIVVSWWLISYYKGRIFKKYEDVIYFLAIISLFFWGWQFISPDSLGKVMTTLDLSGELAASKSIIIYTLHYSFLPGEIPRNAGFTWEPGPFACFIALAMFFNIARNGVSFRDKKRLIIFLITLLTTQSTTGFMLLLSIVIWYAWARYPGRVFRYVSILSAFGIAAYIFFTIPWLHEKILQDSQQNATDIIARAKITGKTYTPGRFAGLQLRWEDFKNYPLAGYGGNSSLQYGYIGDGNVVSAVNGLGTILGKYGAIGAIIFLILIIKSGKYLASFYMYRGFLIFPTLLLIIGFSFGIIESFILVTFWLTPVFLRKSELLGNSYVKQENNIQLTGGSENTIFS